MVSWIASRQRLTSVLRGEGPPKPIPLSELIIAPGRGEGKRREGALTAICGR